MLHKKNNPVITLAVLLAVVGVSKPAKAFLLAQADSNTPTLTQTNPDLESSGTVNADLEGSGTVNADLESSGTVNADLEGSGKINPEFQDSGVVNSDVKESGEVNPDLKESGTANIDAIAQADANPNAADTENAQGDATATKKGNWWWWIPIIIGLPLLALLGISSLKRGNRSDQEPAVGNTPSPNAPQGGSVAFDPDIDGVSPRRTTATGDLGATSNLGGAAIAGGAAATNRIGDRNNQDIEEVDTDRFELENVVAQPETDIDNLIVEIPSDPVNEFTTDQETILRTTEQSTRIQADDLNDSSGLLDNVSATGAALGGSAAAASGFFGDREEETTESVTEDNDTTFETENAREFRGDYVLREESPIEEINLETEDDDTTAIRDTNWVDSTTSEWNAPDNTGSDSVDNTATTEVELSKSEDEIFEPTSGFANNATQTGGAALAGGAAAFGGAATSGLFASQDSEQPTETDLEDTNWVDSTTSEWNAPDNTGSDSVDNTATTEVELSKSEDEIFEPTSGFANDATQTESAAASGLFASQDSEQPTETDLEDTNWVDSTTSEWNAPDSTVSDSVDNTATTEVDSEIEDSDFILDTRINNYFETNIIADAEITSDETDYSLDDLANLDEITFDDADSSVSASSDEFAFDNTTDSSEISLDEISFDDADSSVSASSDEFAFDNTTDSSEISLDEIILDDVDSSVSASSDEFAFDNTTDSSEISLDEITFDDADSSVSASSDEFAFDNTAESSEISLDEITLDDADNSIDDLINSIGTDTLNQRVDLDELGFDERLERKANSPSDLLSDKTAEITDLGDDKSDDMNNISEWLDGLETPNQNTENISEWLENLNADSANTDSEKSNNGKTLRLNEEDDDISFQFLEDLLDRDPNANQENK